MTRILNAFVAALFFFNQAYASQNQKPVVIESIEHFAQIYPKNPTPSAMMTAVQSELPPDIYAFIEKKLNAAKLKTLPSVKLNSQTSLQIEFNGHSLAINFLPDNKIQVNNKTLDLLAAHDVEGQWNLIKSALPKYGQFSLWNYFIKEAQAEDNAERLTGGVMAGTAAVAIGAAEGAVVATGVGAVVLVASYFVWNNGTCLGMGKEKFSCLQTKDEFEEKLKKTPGLLAAWRTHRPRSPTCVAAPENKEIFESLNDYISSNDELFRSIVTCRQTKTDLFNCIRDLSLAAYYLCVQTHGRTDSYLPKYARSNARTTAPHQEGSK